MQGFPLLRLTTLLLIVSLSLLVPRTSWALLLVGADDERVSLYEHVTLLEDPSGELLLADIRNQTHAFRPATELGSLSLGYRQGAVWLKLEVRSQATRAQPWRVVFDYASLDHLQLYDQGTHSLLYSQAGDQYPKTERSLEYRTPLFEFWLKPEETRTLYIRAQSHGSLTLTGQVLSQPSFERASQHSYLVHALYFGILLALGLYNLLLFFGIRERAFLNYVIFLASFAVSILSLHGFGAQYVWTSGAEWTNRILPLSLTLTQVFAVAFTRSFLETKEKFAAADSFLRGLGIVTAMTTLCSLLLPVHYANQAMSLCGLAFTFVLILTGIVCLYRKVPGSGLFTLAWLVLLTGSGLMSMRNFGLIPSNFLTLYGMQVGSALEMILLSLALAERFNQLKRQREAHLQESERLLEKRVAERTLALEEANRRLQDLALRDTLTGLANRMALKSYLELSLLRVKQHDESLAVMLLDLDGFKPINDQYGHEAGDIVLTTTAARLEALLRSHDMAARLGGDEFVVACADIDSEQQAASLAQKILAAVQQPIEIEGQHLKVGASIGIALAEDQDTAQALLKRADRAMYNAKAEGRNRVSLTPVSLAQTC